MQRLICLALGCVLSYLVGCGHQVGSLSDLASNQTLQQQDAISKRLYRLFKIYQRSVLSLSAPLRDGTSNGTGFLVSSDLIITNDHVIQDSIGPITVRWDTHLNLISLKATVVKRHKKRDLALLRLEQKVIYTPLPLAYAHEYAIAEPTVIFGYPGLTQPNDVEEKYLHTLSGLVSSVQPKQLVLDARIMAGNSGGPLVSLLTGQVIGVISSIYVDSDEEDSGEFTEGESLGSAIPIRFVHKLMRGY